MRFSQYLQGLRLLPDRHKTLTGRVGVEPVSRAQAASAQRLQFFVYGSTWDAESMNRRPELMVTDPATAPHEAGELAIDNRGD